MRLPTKFIERTLIKRGVKWLAAVDEVGRGSWAGPVVAAAVLLPARFFLHPPKSLYLLRDSKLLMPRSRESFFTRLISLSTLYWRVAAVKPATIDRLNIHHATFRAMRQALAKLPRTPDIVLVDGKWRIPGVQLPQECFVAGDRRVFSIACASIIAKVTHDRLMVCLAKKYPAYGFEKHKGYGTKFHQAQLASFGPSPVHRRSYRPVSIYA